MEPTKRLFVGVRVPLLPKLCHYADELTGLGSALRVVAPHNWHITLKFLGETTVVTIRGRDGKDQGQSKERSGTHGVIVFDRARENP